MTRTEQNVIWQSKSSWRLVTEEVAVAAGPPLTRGYIDHPGSVVLAPVQAGAVIMLAQYRLALKQSILELPAGTRGWDEDWLVCAQRELREETGLRAQQFVPLGAIWAAPGLSNEEMRLFLALGLTVDPLPMDVDEVIEIRPIPLDTLVRQALNGELADAKSAIAILRAAAFLQHPFPTNL